MDTTFPLAKKFSAMIAGL